MLISAFLLGLVGMTCFVEATEEAVPARAKRAVFPRTVTRTVVEPTVVGEPVAVENSLCATARVTRIGEPRLIQRRVVERTQVATCGECDAVSTDPTRLAKVRTVQPRFVLRTAAGQCDQCEADLAANTPPARVRVVYPRVVSKVAVPECGSDSIEP
jgi:hypothetical protein